MDAVGTGSANIASLTGVNSNSHNSLSSGTIAMQTGVSAGVRVVGAGNTTTASGVSSIPILSSTGNLTTWYGFWGRSPSISSTGAITTAAAIYLDTQDTGANVTTGYGIYQAGTDNNYFTGNVGIGDASPASLFTVGNGDLFEINTSGAITDVRGITNTGAITSSGGAIDLNVSSNFAINVGTGTSNGAVSIGGGSNTVAIDSTALDISTAGVITGATGITSSGTITLSGLESFSEHPIAKAVLSYTQLNNIQAAEITDFESIKGKGLMGKVKQVKYFVGNLALLADLQISFDTQQIEKDTLAGKTPIFLTTENQILAYGLVADSVKPEAKKAISDLHMLGIKTIMLSGDHINTAKAIADEVGIDEVYAEVLPQDKLVKIQEFQSQKFIVAMAGDGVNDAPALAQADVGIAMATGTEVAMETAGITLLHGDITKLVKAIKLSKITMRGIKQNLFWAFIYNIVGIPLAAGLFYPFFGWLLNPIFAGLAMALSSVSVVLNSLRIKTKSI
jgi:soluble P-type ATPase